MADKVKNPCKGVCQFHNSQCLGCFRTLIERCDWATYNEEIKARIVRDLKFRELRARRKAA
jgi:predicted Fe-S protein YdhL (DUF1289 family)